MDIQEKKHTTLLISSLLFSLLTANFILWNGFSLGFFLTALIGEILIFIVLPRPEKRKNLAGSVLFGLCVIALSLTFFVFSDYLLDVINFFVIVLLLLIQLLSHSQALEEDWDSPKFITELFISPFVRPFRFLKDYSSILRDNLIRKAGVEQDKKKDHTVRNIFIGILVSLPFLLIILVLLSSADQVFSKHVGSVLDFLTSLKIGELIFTVVAGSIIFPFMFSFMYSYVIKWVESKGSNFPVPSDPNNFKIDPVIASAFLFCINIVYALFAWVQFSSLFGAFADSLPEGITYAEYAREGFFQLAAASLLNVVIVVLGVMATNRKGPFGIIVRILSVSMILFTYVMLVSAGYRMKMYVTEFDLSRMRLLVSIFMILIAIVLLFALIKEFYNKFKFLKTVFIWALIVLILTNYINPSARITEYNTTAKDAAKYHIDTHYLIYELSFDSVPALIDFSYVSDHDTRKEIETGLTKLYGSYLQDYTGGSWRRINLSKERAKSEIEEFLGDELEEKLKDLGYLDSP